MQEDRKDSTKTPCAPRLPVSPLLTSYMTGARCHNSEILIDTLLLTPTFSDVAQSFPPRPFFQFRDTIRDHITFSHPVSLDFSGLWQFLRLPSFLWPWLFGGVWSGILQTALHLGLFDAMLMTGFEMEGQYRGNVSFSFHQPLPFGVC